MNDLRPTRSDPANPSAPWVFIVDDDPNMGRMLETVLHRHNCRTTLFDDPVTALESFRESDPKPDLLITDYIMPEMTGYELICQCKVIDDALKTLLCSGAVDQTFMESLVPQPDRCLQKPFALVEFLTVVKELMAE